MKKRHARQLHRDGGRRVRLNEFVDQASLEDVLRAIERLPVDLDWALIGPNVVPLLPRRRPLPPASDPVQLLLPPGIMVGFGADAGPAVLHVNSEMLARWGIDAGELTARALDNVRLRTERARPRDVARQSIAGVAVRVFQSGDGVASALLLVPDELVRLFGEGPQRFIAPMRDLLLSVAADAEAGLVPWLNEELASLDPNALAVEPFLLENGELRLDPFDREPARLVATVRGR